MRSLPFLALLTSLACYIVPEPVKRASSVRLDTGVASAFFDVRYTGAPWRHGDAIPALALLSSDRHA